MGYEIFPFDYFSIPESLRSTFGQGFFIVRLCNKSRKLSANFSEQNGVDAIRDGFRDGFGREGRGTRDLSFELASLWAPEHTPDRKKSGFQFLASWRRFAVGRGGRREWKDDKAEVAGQTHHRRTQTLTASECSKARAAGAEQAH